MEAIRRHDAAVPRRDRAQSLAITSDWSAPAHQAHLLLRTGFTVAPILFGLDKFFDLMTTWTQYLAPVFPRTIGVAPEVFMRGVGVIEVVAGVLVGVAPRFFAYLVAAWLALIIIDLLVLGRFYDVALRDFGLMIGAIALGRLSQAMHERRTR